MSDRDKHYDVQLTKVQIKSIALLADKQHGYVLKLLDVSKTLSKEAHLYLERSAEKWLTIKKYLEEVLQEIEGSVDDDRNII